MDLACTPCQELFTVGAERLEHLEVVVEECLENIHDYTEELVELAQKASSELVTDTDDDDEEGGLKADLECAVGDLERARMAQHVRLCFFASV